MLAKKQTNQSKQTKIASHPPQKSKYNKTKQVNA